MSTPDTPPQTPGEQPAPNPYAPGQPATPAGEPPMPRYGQYAEQPPGGQPPAAQPPQYGQYAQQPPQYGQYGTPAAPQQYGQPAYGSYPQNSLGIWSLVMGLVGFLVCGLFAIPAIVVGQKSRRAQAEGTANNGGLGTAGIVIGWVTIALYVLGVLALVLLAQAVGGWDELLRMMQDDWGATFPQ